MIVCPSFKSPLCCEKLEGDRNFFFREENAGNTDCYLATAASLVDSGTAHEAHADLRLLLLSDPGLLRKHSGLSPSSHPLNPRMAGIDLINYRCCNAAYIFHKHNTTSMIKQQITCPTKTLQSWHRL